MGFATKIGEAAKHLRENLDENMDTRDALRKFSREVETASEETRRAMEEILGDQSARRPR